jgi:hypothetical protein
MYSCLDWIGISGLSKELNEARDKRGNIMGQSFWSLAQSASCSFVLCWYISIRHKLLF